ncbi:MAG: hypothetical protein HMLKMBBP_02275 [Planctomycetes bacterium]|nr:hypothetical protein [Planctomycetota bacterium]
MTVPELVIRPERDADVPAIGAVIDAAFEGQPYAEGDEAELVVKLREAGMLTASLVAEIGGSVVGQIAFSPAEPPDGTSGWYALGPVAVLPAHQNRGIGARLVRAGLDAIQALGAKGCILTGDVNYYARFGFRLSPAHCPPGQPPGHFMILVLCGASPEGAIRFHPAFGDCA